MGRIMLENDRLIIEINAAGAELSRIYSKQYQQEVLWNGDARYWKRKSPILFPIVGKLVDDETIIEDKKYILTQHGFARDMKFSLIHADEKSACYSLHWDENTLQYYPYHFELKISYTLTEQKVLVQWEVQNLDTRTMYFSIGAHPAFNIPYKGEDNISDYYIELRGKDTVEQYILHPPYIDGKHIIEKPERITLTSEFFRNDAVVYGGVDSLRLASYVNGMQIHIRFDDFPYVGLWSPYYEERNMIAPFVCIEPWFGLADPTDSTKIFKQKPGILKLAQSEQFLAQYEIEIV